MSGFSQQFPSTRLTMTPRINMRRWDHIRQTDHFLLRNASAAMHSYVAINYVYVHADQTCNQSDFPFMGEAFHRPSRWLARTISRSRNICREAVRMFSLLPATSCHSIGTSVTGIRNCFARSRSSTSNIQVGRCWAGNICCAAERENNLKPHCVSRMWPTPTIRRIVCRPYMRMLRMKER